MAGRIVVSLGALVALGGCALGPRPTLTDERRVDDAAIEAVLTRLDAANGATFTAVYTVASTMQGTPPAEVTVTHSPTETRVVFASDGSVTVEYLTVEGEQRTCTAGQAECVAGHDETRISNLAITSSFWGASTAAKLRTDANRNVADALPSTATLAGQPATCTAVNVGSPAVAPVEYCALDTGPLGAYRGADTVIELVSYTIS